MDLLSCVELPYKPDNLPGLYPIMSPSVALKVGNAVIACVVGLTPVPSPMNISYHEAS